MTAQAQGLPDRCEFVLVHCGKPMLWKGSNTCWQGAPGEGSQISKCDYHCAAGCGAQVRITVAEPS